ncbi:hypothetical protein LUU34_00942200 [Aix galericulata]|nr:hypothetical protein LUU34_00942200 [Aix galericulata]
MGSAEDELCVITAAIPQKRGKMIKLITLIMTALAQEFIQQDQLIPLQDGDLWQRHRTQLLQLSQLNLLKADSVHEAFLARSICEFLGISESPCEVPPPTLWQRLEQERKSPKRRLIGPTHYPQSDIGKNNYHSEYYWDKKMMLVEHSSSSKNPKEDSSSSLAEKGFEPVSLENANESKEAKSVQENVQENLCKSLRSWGPMTITLGSKERAKCSFIVAGTSKRCQTVISLLSLLTRLPYVLCKKKESTENEVRIQHQAPKLKLVHTNRAEVRSSIVCCTSTTYVEGLIRQCNVKGHVIPESKDQNPTAISCRYLIESTSPGTGEAKAFAIDASVLKVRGTNSSEKDTAHFHSSHICL